MTRSYKAERIDDLDPAPIEVTYISGSQTGAIHGCNAADDRIGYRYRATRTLP